MGYTQKYIIYEATALKLILPLAIIAFVLGLSLSINFFGKKDSSPSASQMSFPPGGDFTLHAGEKVVKLSDYNDKLRFIFFGYTSCPDICPTALAFISSSLKELTPEELSQVQVFFVSVDPDRDTPQKLHDYTNYFHENIIGVTGSKEEIDLVTKNYEAKYKIQESDSAMGYLVDHAASVYVVGKKGNIIDMLPHGLPVEAITKTIRDLI